MSESTYASDAAGYPELAHALLEIEVRDEIEFSFKFNGEEHTTRQKVVDIGEMPYGIKVYCEDSPGWNGPSVSLQVQDYGEGGRAVMKELRHPMRSPTYVDEFTEFEVIRDGE